MIRSNLVVHLRYNRHKQETLPYLWFRLPYMNRGWADYSSCCIVQIN